MTRMILAILVSVMLCACQLTLRPTDDNGVIITSPISTNSISGGQLTGAATAICAMFGAPEVGPIAGGMLVAAIWFWRYTRKTRANKQAESCNAP
jgi:hypothetical protein